MTLFSKPKHPRSEVPGVCFRCREQMGTVRLNVIAPKEATDDGDENLWLCPRCAARVRRDGRGN